MSVPKAIPAHRQATLLGVGLILLVVAVVSAALLSLQATARSAAELVQRDDPALNLLLDADRDLNLAQAALGAAIRAPNAAERIPALARFTEMQRLSAEQFIAFRERSAELPDPQQYLGAYLAHHATWSQLAAELPGHNDDPAMPARFGRLLEEFASMRSALEGIEEHMLRPVLQGESERLMRQTRQLQWMLGVALAFALILGSFGTLKGVRAIRDQHAEMLAEKRERERDVQRREFDGRLHRALELVRTEDNALEVVHGALSEVALPCQRAEMLLADSSMTQLERVADTGGTGEQSGCAVTVPQDCPAIRRNTPLSFLDSEQFDVCPHLRHRGTSPCSALCLPVSIMGRTAGVLHVVGPADQIPDTDQRRALQSIAAQAGDEIGLMRAFATKERQANTDTLTGLRNRRSLESKISAVAAEQHYTVAFVDIDHFKRLNDSHGHDTGDRALRLFADVLRASLRPEDHAARWGGEEFVLVLPKVTGAPALRVLKRIRDALAQRLAGGTVPTFTVSMGVSDSLNAGSFDDVVKAADEALLRAKRDGRDRIVWAAPAARPADSGTRSEAAAIPIARIFGDAAER
jgi:diguanylate cyclase (GGDEF)-like protein